MTTLIQRKILIKMLYNLLEIIEIIYLFLIENKIVYWRKRYLTK